MRNYTPKVSRWCWLAGIPIALVIASEPLAATDEQTLTTAFLYNFLKFVDWPDATLIDDEITICVADSTALNEGLDAIAGRSAQNRTVKISRLELGDNPNRCQLLFLPREEKPIRLKEWIKNTQSLPILTVSNYEGFLDINGMIALIPDDNHLQIEVNLAPAKLSDLTISAQLLKIARQVRTGD